MFDLIPSIAAGAFVAAPVILYALTLGRPLPRSNDRSREEGAAFRH